MWRIQLLSGKHVHEMYTPLYPTFMYLPGHTIFLTLDPKHRLWVFVRTASLTINVLSKNIKNINFFLMKYFQFLQLQKILYIAWACYHNE